MENNKIKRIIKLVLNDIAEIYLYFFGFYVVCLILSHFFESWKLFFNWRAFHISIVLFGILSLLSDKAKGIIFSEKNLGKFGKLVELINGHFKSGVGKINLKGFFERFYKIAQIAASLFFGFIKDISEVLISFINVRIKRLSKKSILKIGAILVILIYFLHKGMNVVDFLILTYALISILFIIESRIAAGIALAFLASCPILLILKKESIAEQTAIYAYYFLVITVLIQIREYMKENSVKNLAKMSKKVIHS